MKTPDMGGPLVPKELTFSIMAARLEILIAGIAGHFFHWADGVIKFIPRILKLF